MSPAVNSGPVVVVAATVSDVLPEAVESELSEQPGMDTPTMRKILSIMKIVAERSMHYDYSVDY
jgi:transcription initiation factor IIE alpha subunit